VSGGVDSPGGTLVVTGRATPSGVTGFSPHLALFVYPTLGCGVLFFPVPCLSRRDGVFFGCRRAGRLGGRS